MNTQIKMAVFFPLTLLLVFASPAFPLDYGVQKEQAAIAAAERFLTAVDAGQYQESWAEASSLFKSQITRDEWVSRIARLRPLFGAVIHRTVKSTRYLTSPPGAPDGEYVMILFQTSFTNKKDAIETVTPTLDKDGQWRVSGYFIK